MKNLFLILTSSSSIAKSKTKVLETEMSTNHQTNVFSVQIG